MDQRVKQVVVEEAQQFKAISTDAVKSRAYVYPIRVGSRLFVLAGEDR